MTAYCRTYVCLALLLAAPVLSRGQVVTTLEENGGGVVTSMEENTIQEDDYAASGIFSDWSDLLEDFSAYGDGTAAEPIPDHGAAAETRIVRAGGKEYRIPTMMDGNGVDLYMLTPDGIAVYMALSSPVYYQQPDEEVVRWIWYYAQKNRERTRLMFRRYSRWAQTLKEYFRAFGIPPELSEICLIESGCTYDAQSSAGAMGMWQIMPGTGRDHGLEVSLRKDDRTDPVLSTQAAAEILLDNYGRVGDWTLAAAAYNCGPGRIRSEIGKGRVSWEMMKGSLPRETSHYIPGLLAIHYVWTYRDRLGLQ